MNKILKSVLLFIKQNIVYVIIVVLASFPIFSATLFQGHDIYFHLMRIEGLSEGLRSGQIPVHIQPTWYGGFGYASSVFYGDLFLYFPALLRLCGLTLQDSYKAYILFCNIGTMAIAKYSFQGIFENRNISIFGSGLYVLSIYRLMNMYTRASLGEYTGMIFLPLVVYACYLLLHRERNKKTIRKGSLLLALSMSAILQCHIITAEMVVIMLVIIVCIYFRRIFNREIIVAGIKAVFLTCVISAWFIIPFLDYALTEKFNVNAIRGGARVDAYIQGNGAFISQLGKLFSSSQGENLARDAGIVGEMEVGVGLNLVLALFAFIILSFVLKRDKDKKEWKIAKIACFFSFLCLWMSTVYFPWDRLKETNILVRYFVINIQFPWRFSGIASLSLTILWCAILKLIVDKYTIKVQEIIASIILFLTVFSTVYFLQDLFISGKPILIESVNDMDSFVKSGEEYLPVNTVLLDLSEDNLVQEEGLILANYIKKGTYIKFTCQNTTYIEKVLELPLLYYRGYQGIAIGEDGKREAIEVYNGNNNVVRMVIKPNWNGSIKVKYQEPWYWRLSELLSLTTCVGIIFSKKLKEKVK